MRMESRRVFVTGHLGYIGTVLVPMLEEVGHEVVGTDTDLFRACTFGGALPAVPNIGKDIRDITEADLQDYDAVIHLAGLSNDPLGNLNPKLTYDINHLATVSLANAAKKAGVPRFIFSSSCANYGAAGDEMNDETAECHPVTPYGEAKVFAERDVAPLANDRFTPVFLRNATVYGLSPRIRFDLVLNNLVAWAVTTGRIFMKSDGTPWRPIVHVRDVALAFRCVLGAPREVVHNQAFNVGRNDENYRICEIAEVVAETIPNCRIDYAEDAGPDKRCYRVDCSKLPNTLPTFQPQWTARRGAAELYQAFKDFGLTEQDFEGARFSRIAHIKQLLAAGHIVDDLRWSQSATVEAGNAKV